MVWGCLALLSANVDGVGSLEQPQLLKIRRDPLGHASTNQTKTRQVRLVMADRRRQSSPPMTNTNEMKNISVPMTNTWGGKPRCFAP
jgi:hypothetical protein